MSHDMERRELINRIRTVKGHLGGIEKMIEEQKCCEDVLVQIAAVKAAVDKIGMTIIENYAGDCIKAALEDPANMDYKVKSIVHVLSKFSK